MPFSIVKFMFIAVLFNAGGIALSQAEMTSLYNEYMKINENSKRIKDAKIKKSISIITTIDKPDTLNIN